MTAPTTKSGPARGPKPRTPRSRRRRWLVRIAIGLGVLVLLGVGLFAYAYATIDVPDPNEGFSDETTFVYYADGETQIGKFATQDRTRVSLDEVPQHVQDAVVAAEDRTFWTNRGIDPKGILRAAFSNVRGQPTQGASTITQQYVKILYLTQEHSYTRKVKEAVLSLKIQRQMSKPEILEGYLNTIYFGRGAYGIEAAAQAYFDTSAADLTVREGAALAAVLNSPNALDPAGGAAAREALTERYAYVIDGMEEMGTLPAGIAGTPAATTLPRFPKVSTQDQLGGQRGHMLALVREELLDAGYTEADIYGGGLGVTTTFTRKAMGAAEQAVKEQAPEGIPRGKKGLHVAVASVQPATGALRGMYAGQDYLQSQVNWAVAGGAVGSTMKPYALAAGLTEGYALTSTFNGNSPLDVGGTEFSNQGEGGGSSYGSAISLLTATEKSVNTAFVDLTDSMTDGPKKVLDTAVAMGVPRDARDLEPDTGIALGTAIISPIDMAAGYGTIADDGMAKDWYVVESVADSDGTVLEEHDVDATRAISSDVAADTSYALQQVTAVGTGTNANTLGRPVAGKTGTATDDEGHVRSSWFVGYTPQLSTAVMFVRGNGQEPLDGFLPTFYGGEYPARTWAATMERVMAGLPVEDFPESANLEQTAEGPEAAPTYTPPPETTAPEPTPSPTQRPTRRPTPTPTVEPTPTEPTPTRPTPPTQTPSPPGDAGGAGGGAAGGAAGGDAGAAVLPGSAGGTRNRAYRSTRVGGRRDARAA